MKSQNTEVVELGFDTPRSWNPSTMGEIGRYLNGFAFNSKTWSKSGRPIIRIQNLTGSGSEFNFFEGDIEDRYVVRPGDLLFSWSATLGVFTWRGPEAVLNQHIFKVESKIDQDFHRYVLEHAISAMQQQTHGTGMVHITKKKFEALPVAVPPIEEQRRIVEILDEQLSRLDAALESVRVVREKAAQFRRSLLHAAFTDESADWESAERRPFSAVFDTARIGSRKVKLKDYQTSGAIPVVDQGADFVGGFTDDESMKFDGCIPVVLFGDHTRRVKFVDFDFAVGADGLKVLTPSNDVDPRFGYWLVESCELRAKGYSRHFAELKAQEFVVPSLDVQRKVSKRLDLATSQLERSLRDLTILESGFGRLRRSLLHAAFTGELTASWRNSR